MFKEALGALSSSLVGAVKDTVSEYKPTARNMGGAFTRIAQQGIANLSFRSPILADMAATMLHNFQHELSNRETVKQYVASDKSQGLRTAVEDNLGKDASKEKIDAQMFKILDKMRSLVEREGEKAAKASDTFKMYGEFFEKFKNDLNPKREPKNQSGQGTGQGDGISSGTLDAIKVNTENTVKILADMAVGDASKPSPTGTNTPTGTNPSNSYVDPYTGLPSVGAAMSGIGGNFLARIFDDETISKYANKAKKILFGEDSEATATPKTDSISGLITPEFRPKDIPVKTTPAPRENNVATILGDLSLELATSKPKADVEGTREENVIDAKQHKETTDVSHASKTLHEKTLEELKSLHETTKEASGKSGGIFSTIASIAGSLLPALGVLGGGSMLGGVAAKAGGAISAVGSVLNPVAKVAGAGAAGYALGSAVVNPLIDGAISKATGQDHSLGTWLYDMFNDDANIQANTPTPLPKIAANQTVAAVEKMEGAKAAREAENNKAQQTSINPVAINSTTNNSSNTNVIMGDSVRNNESTYERVQMTNFWGPV